MYASDFLVLPKWVVVAYCHSREGQFVFVCDVHINILWVAVDLSNVLYGDVQEQRGGSQDG